MKNLIKKLFSKKQEHVPVIGRTFNPDTLKPLFEANGIDMEKIGFPSMEYRNHESRSMAYDVRFNDVTMIPVLIDGKYSQIITGKYFTQALEGGFSDESGHPQRAEPSFYDFTIQEGKLNLKRKN